LEVQVPDQSDVTRVGSVIDACVHEPLPPAGELFPYFTEEWQEYVGRPGSLPGGRGSRPVHVNSPYRSSHPVERVDGAVLPEGDFDRAVLMPEAGVTLGAEPNPHLAEQVARAANDWLLERRLDGSDNRLYGAIVVPNQVPEKAAQEIRRVGKHERMVAVLLGSTGIGRPFGNPVYDPIFEAAEELDLPIVIHASGDAVLDSIPHPAGGGSPATYAEVKALAGQPLMTHLASLVAQGVFEKFPTIRVLLVGGGFTWLPGLIWRFDTNFKGIRRETPWVKRLPSEYIVESVRVTTYPLDTRDPSAMQRVMGTFGGFEEMLCFATGHPHSDWDRPEDVAAGIPSTWQDKVFRENAGKLYRLAGVGEAVKAP
jgi:uncharacterized protein